MTDGQATAGGEPSVFQWAFTAWRDAFAAFRQMPGVLGIAALASFAVNLVTLPVLLHQGKSLGGDVAGTIVVLLDGFVVTPAAIAVHRFVLLGECATKYRLEPSEPRFRRFFFFVVVVQLITAIPLALAHLAHNNIPGSLGAALALLLVAVTFASLFLVLRLLLLFPAFAVDAPGAAWTNALQDTKGHAWRMLLIVIVTGIPLVALVMFVSAALHYILSGLGAEVLSRMVASVLQAIKSILTVVPYAALASRMFAAFADRLKAPADQPATA
jgi:hypothetical protein